MCIRDRTEPDHEKRLIRVAVYAQNDGRWNGSINPTDLQGWSTDSSVEGTRCLLYTSQTSARIPLI